MDDQIDEKEVLEDGSWNQDYDIAEDEEERLLTEEDQLLELAHQDDKEAVEYELYETEEAAEEEENAAADETVETEEDILDLDANEDVVEFEEAQVNGIEESSMGSQSNSSEPPTLAPNQASTQDTSQKSVTQAKRNGAQRKFMPYPRNPQMRGNLMQNRANHAINVQMGYSAIRQRPGFAKQMRPIDPHMHQTVGRRPLMPDPHFPPPPLNPPRHMNRIDPLMPNFPPRMPPNPLRFEQAPFSFTHLMQNELNQGARRFFINPPYPPRNFRDMRDHPCGHVPPFTEIRSSFSSGDILPKLFHGPPPPRPHDMINLPHPRFSTNLPPPPLPVHAAANPLGPGPNVRMKLQAPQSLMDIVLPVAFGETPIQPPIFQDRQQRFRFGSPEQRSHRTDYPPPSGPSSIGCKRPPANEAPVIPVNQLRNEPRPPMHRTINNHTETSTAGLRPAGNGAKNLIRPSQLSSPNSRRALLETPKTTAALLPTPSPAATVVATTPVASTAGITIAAPAAMKIDTQGDGTSQEMDEYMKKMEEQRKKREEVLRMKEERRRLKLAGQPDAAKMSSHSTNSSPGKITNKTGEHSGTVPETKIPVTSLRPKESTGSGNEPVKSIPVTPQSASTATQQNAEPHRRFKVIIVKSKSGKILEKRRVPIGERGDADLKKAYDQVASTWSNGRMSETVEIENLNLSATEEDIRRLCQMFGPVLEVYPKLQEGKAVVRFASPKGANNFFSNHNIPGIAVRYL